MTVFECIGPSQLARLTGLSIKALRHYERKGLLKPERTANGWRSYSPADVERVTRVLTFRQMGFTLAEIGTLLDAAPAEVAAALCAQEARLAGQRQALDTSLAAVRRARRQAGDTGDRPGPAEAPRDPALVLSRAA